MKARQDVPGLPVQGAELPVNPLHQFRLRELRLGRCGDDADAEGLRKDQHVSRLRAAVGPDPLRVHEAADRKPVNRLCSVNGMSAGDDGAGLIGLVVAAPQNFLDGLLLHAVGNAHDVEAELRLAAHGINIAEGIGRRDLPVKEGIVHNRRKKVRGLDQCPFLVQKINAGVITFVIAYQQTIIGMGSEALQKPGQGAGTHLGTAACTDRQLRQFHFRFHCVLLHLSLHRNVYGPGCQSTPRILR